MINQKAREIAERAFDSTASYPEKRFQAARLGIIEGRRQAFEEAAKVASGLYAPHLNNGAREWDEWSYASAKVATAIRDAANKLANNA